MLGSSCWEATPVLPVQPWRCMPRFYLPSCCPTLHAALQAALLEVRTEEHMLFTADSLKVNPPAGTHPPAAPCEHACLPIALFASRTVFRSARSGAAAAAARQPRPRLALAARGGCHSRMAESDMLTALRSLVLHGEEEDAKRGARTAAAVGRSPAAAGEPQRAKDALTSVLELEHGSSVAPPSVWTVNCIH